MAAVTTNGLNGFAAPSASSATKAAPNKSFFARLFASIQDARMRQAEREIARFIDLKGGRLTDDVEREIARTFI